MIRLILAALLPLGVWAHAHPRLAVLAAAALVLAAVAVVRAVRDFGPPLAAVTWNPPAARLRPCPSCGWA
jgi:hypothetical protein